jgi:hypothetical protein
MRLRGGITAFALILSATGCAGLARRGGGVSVPTPGPSPSPAAAAESTGATAPTASGPLVREIVLEGVSALTPEAVYSAIRLRPGGRLRRAPPDVAADLEQRYRTRGYLGARVGAVWDADRGVLTLRADEGRLREVTFEGVEGPTEERVRALMALVPGAILEEKHVRSALGRIEDGSAGAFRLADPPYVVEPLPEGVRLRVAVTPVRARVRVRLQGPDPSPLHTRVEGTAPGGGLDLTLFDPASLDHAHVYALGAYAFSSHDWRFALGAQRPFAAHRLVLGYEFHDLTDTDDVFRRFPVTPPPGRVHVLAIMEDYYRRRGHEAYAFVLPSTRLHFGASWRRDRLESLPVVAKDSIFFFSRRPRPNPAVEDGLRNAVLLTGQWAVGAPLFRSAAAERDSFLVRDPYGSALDIPQTARVDATMEIGGRAGPGTTTYRRLIGHLRGKRTVTPTLAFDGRVLFGLGWDLPPQRRFALGGAGTLRGYALKEFSGQRVVLGTLEARLRPSGRWPDVIGFYDGGAAWTRGRSGAGWRDDVGGGVEWPGGGEGHLRLDIGYALRPPPGQDRTRVYAAVYLPF